MKHPEDVIELILGVRQGGPESPSLYNLFMDYVMRIYTHQCEEEDITLKYCIRSTATPSEGRKIKGRKMKSYRGEHTIDWIGYADDLELYFEDVTNLQKGITLLNDAFNRLPYSDKCIKNKNHDRQLQIYKFK